MKPEGDVIKEFNEIVNMTAEELEAFLKTGDSTSTGWSKDDGSGESIGHESGRKIVKILQSNPDKDPSKYSEEDVEHMRRVVSYCKRHLAQEEHLKSEKSPEELEKSKSTRSLKNWGHDPMKTLKGGSSGKPASKKADKPASKKAEKPASKKAEKPASKKAEKPISKKEDKPAEKAEKPTSKKAEKPVSKKTEKPVSKKADTAEKKDEKKADKDEKAEAGEKRAAEENPAASEKPPSKKAKTTKPPSEGSRKPPSRGAKKT